MFHENLLAHDKIEKYANSYDFCQFYECLVFRKSYELHRSHISHSRQYLKMNEEKTQEFLLSNRIDILFHYLLLFTISQWFVEFIDNFACFDGL